MTGKDVSVCNSGSGSEIPKPSPTDIFHEADSSEEFVWLTEQSFVDIFVDNPSLDGVPRSTTGLGRGKIGDGDAASRTGSRRGLTGHVNGGVEAKASS
jgi:hypothetical protein